MVQLIQLMVQKMCPYRIIMIFLGEITHENTFEKEQNPSADYQNDTNFRTCLWECKGRYP